MTYSSDNKVQGNTRKGSENQAELDTNIKTILEEADINGGLNDFVFVKTGFRAVTISLRL